MDAVLACGGGCTTRIGAHGLVAYLPLPHMPGAILGDGRCRHPRRTKDVDEFVYRLYGGRWQTGRYTCNSRSGPRRMASRAAISRPAVSRTGTVLPMVRVHGPAAPARWAALASGAWPPARVEIGPASGHGFGGVRQQRTVDGR